MQRVLTYVFVVQFLSISTFTINSNTQRAAMASLPLTTPSDIWAEPFLHTPINTSCLNNFKHRILMPEMFMYFHDAFYMYMSDGDTSTFPSLPSWLSLSYSSSLLLTPPPPPPPPQPVMEAAGIAMKCQGLTLPRPTVCWWSLLIMQQKTPPASLTSPCLGEGSLPLWWKPMTE